MKWANPHAWIYIDVAGKDGKVEMGVGNWRGQRAVSTRLEKGRSGRRDRAGDRRLPGAQRIQDRQRDEHHLRERQASLRRFLISKQRDEVERGFLVHRSSRRRWMLPPADKSAECSIILRACTYNSIYA